MYNKSQRVLTLEKQLSKLQLESKELYDKLQEQNEKRKVKIGEIFLDSIKSKLNLDYSVRLDYSGFQIFNKEFESRFEVELNEVTDYSKMTSIFKLEISQNSWFNSFSDFKVESNDKKEVGKYFFLKDYLTIVEEVTMSNVYSDLKDLFLESRNGYKRIDSIYGQDISNLEILIKEENEKTISDLMESVTEIRYNKPESEKPYRMELGFKILKRTPKKLVIKKFRNGFVIPEHPSYEENMKKEDLKYYIESLVYDVI